MRKIIISLILCSFFIISKIQAEVAPSFSLPDLNGNYISLKSFWGKIVLINFWATWCPVCRKEVIQLIRLKNKFKDNIEILGISLDQNEKILKHFVKYSNINYKVLKGNLEVVKSYGNFRVIPISFLIDRSGNIRKIYKGFVEFENFSKDIKKLLFEGRL